jgi:hypothetical protein
MSDYSSSYSSHFHGSYAASDVHLLFTPHLISEQPSEETINAVSGVQAVEYQPSEAYLKFFYATFAQNRRRLAQDILSLARQLMFRSRKRPRLLVSLARAGIPIGVLLKRTLQEHLKVDMAHYSVSLLSDAGLDENALHYILQHHDPLGRDITFVDGWTATGTVARALWQGISHFNRKHKTQISPDLHVIADLAGIATIAATTEDYLIPSALLNATINGLVSRPWRLETELDSFFNCYFFEYRLDEDLSRWYVEQLLSEIKQLDNTPPCIQPEVRIRQQETSQTFMDEMIKTYRLASLRQFKPGLGESTRLLLQGNGQASELLVRNRRSSDVEGLLLLANEQGIPVTEMSSMPYKAALVMTKE